KLEPRNPKVLVDLSNSYANIGEPQKAVEYVDQALRLDRYNAPYYDFSINLKTTIAKSYLEANETERAKELARASIADYETYRKLFDPYQGRRIPDMREIHLADRTYVYVSQSYVMLAQYEKAMEALDQ